MQKFTNGGVSFAAFTELSDQDLFEYVKSMNRYEIISWLSWNDPNGIYEDKQSIKELGRKMSKEEGIEIMLRQVLENRSLIK